MQRFPQIASREMLIMYPLCGLCIVWVQKLHPLNAEVTLPTLGIYLPCRNGGEDLTTITMFTRARGLDLCIDFSYSSCN